MKNNKKATNILLIILVIALAIIPFFVAKGKDFEGADDKAEGVIEEIRPDYEPWAQPLFEAPSGEIESLLFALQAAIGSGIVFYYFGYQKGKKSALKEKENK